MTFYVYLHLKATTGEVFYVGKGHGDRATQIGRNPWWSRVVNKHGYRVEFVQADLQEWYAHELERELIALYGRRNLGLGPLVNLTDGGEGVSGLIHSPESRAKMSASFRAAYTPELKARMGAARRGKKQAPATTAKRGASLQRKWASYTAEEREARCLAFTGWKMSEEGRKKIGASKKGQLVPEDVRLKISATVKSQMTPERKALMSEIGKAVMTPELRAHLSKKTSETMTPEHRAHLSKMHLGKEIAPETRQKIAAGHLGKPKSKEACETMKESWKKRKEAPGYQDMLKAAAAKRLANPKLREKLSNSWTDERKAKHTARLLAASAAMTPEQKRAKVDAALAARGITRTGSQASASSHGNQPL